MFDLAGESVGALSHRGEEVADESRMEFAGRGAHRGHPAHVEEQHDGIFRGYRVEIEG